MGYNTLQACLELSVDRLYLHRQQTQNVRALLVPGPVVAMNEMSLRGLHLSSLAPEVDETDSLHQPLSLVNVGSTHYLASLVQCMLPPC